MSQVAPRAKATASDSLSPKQSDSALLPRLQLSEPFFPFHSLPGDLISLLVLEHMEPVWYQAQPTPWFAGQTPFLSSPSPSLPFTYLFLNEALLGHTI